MLTVASANLTNVIISVAHADTPGVPIGYVARGYNTYNVLVLTTNVLEALRVDISAGSGVAIKRDNGDDLGAHPYLGFVAGSGDPNFATNSDQYAFLTGTSYLAPKSIQAGGNSYSSYFASETSVWSSQAGSNVLTPTWTNTDGSAAPTTLLNAASDGSFLITGSVSKLSARFSGDTLRAVIFTAV